MLKLRFSILELCLNKINLHIGNTFHVLILLDFSISLLLVHDVGGSHIAVLALVLLLDLLEQDLGLPKVLDGFFGLVDSPDLAVE